MPPNKPSKRTHTTVDTILFTREEAEKWWNPPFQRPLRINQKVLELAKAIEEDGGVMPGVLTLGKIDGSPGVYLLDGQHRRAAAMQTKLDEFYSDVRTHVFSDMGAMGDEFVKLNSSLVRLKPDDILRGLEGSTPWLAKLRKECPFVGYDMIRRGEKAPIVSMSLLLRAWLGSVPETPKSSGESAASFVKILSVEEAAALTTFTKLCFSAWGRDEATYRMWGGLNLTLCAWLYRRLVLMPVAGVKRYAKVSNDMFGKCLMSLSTSDKYIDYLAGRTLSEHSRAPTFDRMKVLFARRIQDETKSDKRPLLPQPPWALSHGKGGVV